jgi:Raf kinase inhibitor-like YbhB/YbcL family protein
MGVWLKNNYIWTMPTLLHSFLFVAIFAIFTQCREKVPTQNSIPLSITSASIKTDTIPNAYSCKAGVNEKIPQLSLTGDPNKIKSLVLVLDDPDAIPVAGKIWNHWLLYDIPVNTEIADKTSKCGGLPKGTKYGITSFGDTCYGGPCPPAGQLHHYHFRLYGINKASLGLTTGATIAEMRAAMAGAVVDSTELVGLFRQ